MESEIPCETDGFRTCPRNSQAGGIYEKSSHTGSFVLQFWWETIGLRISVLMENSNIDWDGNEDPDGAIFSRKSFI